MKKSNRWNSLVPRGRKFWCYNCDGALVRIGAKCPACRHKQQGKTRVKPSRRLPIGEEDA